jgi:hypothetical protein
LVDVANHSHSFLKAVNMTLRYFHYSDRKLKSADRLHEGQYPRSLHTFRAVGRRLPVRTLFVNCGSVWMTSDGSETGAPFHRLDHRRWPIKSRSNLIRIVPAPLNFSSETF